MSSCREQSYVYLNGMRTDDTQADSVRKRALHDSTVVHNLGAFEQEHSGYQSSPAGAHRAAVLELDCLGAAAVVTDLHGMIVDMTPSARRLLRRLSSLPNAPAGVAAEHLPEGLWRACRGKVQGEPFEWRVTADGPMIAVVRYTQGAARYVLILRELCPAGEPLSRRLHQQRLEMTGRLVAMIAHDLRVPLSSILFNADAGIERRLRSDESAEILQDIRAAADSIRRSIDGLLDFACLGAAQSTTVDLSSVVERVESLLRPTARDGGHRLVVSLSADAVCARGNALVIEQVLVNLLLNAMQAARGPATIHIRSLGFQRAALPHDICDGSSEQVVCLTVQDDGPGIAAELSEQVFEPFFTTKASGMGLGLPMAREAVASLGATLTLEPSLQGAKFALWLPTCAETDEVTMKNPKTMEAGFDSIVPDTSEVVELR